jgi:hypothetical protein
MVLLLKNRLEQTQQQNIQLIRRCQEKNLPLPSLRAANPLPNRQLVVIKSTPSTHEYGITFDSIVPSTSSEPQIEREIIQEALPSRSSTAQSRATSVITITKDEKKGFRLNILKIFKSKSKKKAIPALPPPPPSPPIEDPSPVPCPSIRTSNRQSFHRPQHTPDSYIFSMQPLPSRLDSSRGVKERLTPNKRILEKFLLPAHVALPRPTRDVLREYRQRSSTEEVLVSETRTRYAGRALAEWEVIVRQCDLFVDAVCRRRESIPEELEEEEDDGNMYLRSNSRTEGRSPVWTNWCDGIVIPRMTVEVPKFYFTGRDK